MMWFFAVLIVVAMTFVALAATGRFGGMAEVYDDRPDSQVPSGRPLTAEDLEAVRFTSALRGYRMSEVDELLDRLTAELREARGDLPAEPAERAAPAAPVDESAEPAAGER